ncbi:CBS domain-containing protein [Plasmodiophora brassicae]
MVSLMSRFGPLEELLSAPIQDAMSGRKAIVLSAATSVRQAVATLAENRILSAPVVESEGAVRGFVDYMDIVAYMSATGDIEKRFTDRVDAVAGQSKLNPYLHLLGTTPIKTVVEIFSSGIHRCAVFDREAQVSGMVSQSDIVRYIAKHIHEPHLQAYANATVAHAGWGNRPVTSVREGESVKNVIMLMHERGVSAVAIVSRTGTLVGNFCLSDMRGIHEHNFERKLNTCVVDYLQAESPDSLRAACTTLKSTVGDVIRALATERLHRLWIVEQDHPIGVVTLTDVMTSLVRFGPGFSHVGRDLPIPGSLTVDILGCHGIHGSWLTKPYVVALIPGQLRAQFVTPVAEESHEPRWPSHPFKIPIDKSNARDSLVFLVKSQRFIGADDDLGYLAVSFDWVLSGFGAGPGCTKIDDWFALKPRSAGEADCGQLRLSMVYEPTA